MRARGVCVLLQGQTEFIEKYCEVVGELRARGFSVAALDWRGQGGSARALGNSLKVHVGDFAEFDDDLRSFLDQVAAPLPGAKIALAHSMGAHILLRNLARFEGRFACAALTAPMLEVQTHGVPPALARAASRIMNWRGAGEEFVWGMERREPLTARFEENRITSDRARFERMKALLAQKPEIRLSGPTFGWLEAAYRSMAVTARPGFAEAIGTPVLVAGAGRDRIVVTQAVRRFAARLPHGEYVEIADAEHEILMEHDSARAEFWRAFDAFVARHLDG